MARESSRRESSRTVVMVDIRLGPSTPASTAAWRRFWTALIAQVDSPEGERPPMRTRGDHGGPAVMKLGRRDPKGESEHERHTPPGLPG